MSYIEKLFDSTSCSLDYQHISEGHTGQNGKILQSSSSPPLINWSWDLKTLGFSLVVSSSPSGCPLFPSLPLPSPLLALPPLLEAPWWSPPWGWPAAGIVSWSSSLYLGQTVEKPQELAGKICPREVLREIRLSRGAQTRGKV